MSIGQELVLEELLLEELDIELELLVLLKVDVLEELVDDSLLVEPLLEVEEELSKEVTALLDGMQPTTSNNVAIGTSNNFFFLIIKQLLLYSSPIRNQYSIIKVKFSALVIHIPLQFSYLTVSGTI